ncbi:MAG TPA: hypothetical protein VLA49_00575 [Anaerolineales bacterium]|nr:hypothetical protein [Anaerolineales bacterium]
MNINDVPADKEVDLYEIRLEGHLAERWVSHFGEGSITLEEHGITRLTCPVVDQAALFGLLKKVRDVALPLLSVTRIKTGGITVAED